MNAADAVAAQPPVRGCCLGFDFGLRRIGVAVGQTLTASARPLATVNHGDAPDWARIDALLREWRPVALVVGLPLGLDGGEQPITRRARAFGVALTERSGLPVHYHDERYSSREADARFVAQRQAGTKRRRHAADLDAMAAAIILESWFAARHA